jgi:hypothetical protein
LEYLQLANGLVTDLVLGGGNNISQ